MTGPSHWPRGAAESRDQRYCIMLQYHTVQPGSTHQVLEQPLRVGQVLGVGEVEPKLLPPAAGGRSAAWLLASVLAAPCLVPPLPFCAPAPAPCWPVVRRCCSCPVEGSCHEYYQITNPLLRRQLTCTPGSLPWRDARCCQTGSAAHPTPPTARAAAAAGCGRRLSALMRPHAQEV